MIQLKDSMAPVIKFDHTAVYLTEEVSAEEMKEAVLAGVTVTDNRDGIISDYSVDGIPQEVIPGYYTIRLKRRTVQETEVLQNVLCILHTKMNLQY